MSVTSFHSMIGGLEEDFATAIAQAQQLVTQYDNAPFTKPAPPGPWARMRVIRGETTLIEINRVGFRTFRTVGILSVQLFVALELGEGEATQMADIIANRYRGITRAGCLFRSPTIGDGSRDGPWWTLTVFCPFHADRIA
jgi:hypothetical protein